MADERQDEDDRSGGLWARPESERGSDWASPEAPGGADRPWQSPDVSGSSAPPGAGSPAAGAWQRPAPPPPEWQSAQARGDQPGGAVLARFESLDGRARAARSALIFVAVMAVVVAIGDVLELRLLDRIAAGEPITQQEADGNNSRQGLFALVQFLAFVVAGATFIRWMNLAYRGLDALGATRRYHTGWSIGGWFVPIMNLWRPKQVANDLWRASSEDGDPADSGLLLGWWIAFLAGSFLGQAVGRLAFADDGTIEDGRRLNYVDIAASAADVVGVVLAIAVIAAITTRLHRRAGLPPA